MEWHAAGIRRGDRAIRRRREQAMKHQGKGVIRLGDGTSHGGKVVAASSGTIVQGKPAALVGDMTACPQCKGPFPIQSASSGNKHEGREYAYDGDTAACGARLISSVG
jgi:uncharacterized Zn-binding protein involved in type VI secretion